MTQMPSESVLKWAADAVGVGARVVAVEGLHEGSGPWWLRVEHAGTIHEVVLRVAGRIRDPGIATGAAALRVAEQYGLAAPRLLAA
ncbi:MAG: aminoglycoside phosphotransferase family protein, partial [Chloroflexota bacterium]